jgi:hypothetical protein
MSGTAVVLIILAFTVALVVAQAGVSAVIEGIFDVLLRSAPERRRLSPTFLTSLSLSDAIGAARQAASAAAASDTRDYANAQGLTVAFATGARIEVMVAADRVSGTRVRVAPGTPSSDDSTMAQYRGALLAALRERDPAARQK